MKNISSVNRTNPHVATAFVWMQAEDLDFRW
jgi:hypothetical protein